jgi:hypothetical protein
MRARVLTGDAEMRLRDVHPPLFNTLEECYR